MTYTNVKKILADHDPEVMAEYEPLVPMFEKMAELAAILRKKRMKRGSIDFDFPETKVILDRNGNPVDIRPYDRNVATKLIEDFMLAANETVAAEYYWRERFRLLSLGLSAVIPVLPGFPAQQPATACFIRSQLSTFRQSYHSILLGASSKPVPSSKRTLPPVTARGVS